jgi:hypothetical protein
MGKGKKNRVTNSTDKKRENPQIEEGKSIISNKNSGKLKDSAGQDEIIRSDKEAYTRAPTAEMDSPLLIASPLVECEMIAPIEEIDKTVETECNENINHTFERDLDIAIESDAPDMEIYTSLSKLQMMKIAKEEVEFVRAGLQEDNYESLPSDGFVESLKQSMFAYLEMIAVFDLTEISAKIDQCRDHLPNTIRSLLPMFLYIPIKVQLLLWIIVLRIIFNVTCYQLRLLISLFLFPFQMFEKSIYLLGTSGIYLIIFFLNQVPGGQHVPVAVNGHAH